MVVAKGNRNKELAKRKRGEQTKLRWGKGKEQENTRKIIPAQPAWGDFISHKTDRCRILYNNVNTISYGSALADCSLLAENAVRRGRKLWVGRKQTSIGHTEILNGIAHR
jgi:hypothetical protein